MWLDLYGKTNRPRGAAEGDGAGQEREYLKLLLLADNVFAGATADRHASHGYTAEAASDATVATTISTALNNLAAGSVAGGAMDTNTIGSFFNSAEAAAEIH